MYELSKMRRLAKRLVVAAVVCTAGLARCGNVWETGTWDVGSFSPAIGNVLAGLLPDSASVVGTGIQQVVDSGLTFGGLDKLTDGQCPGPQSDDGVAERCAIGQKAEIVYSLALPTDLREIRIYSMWKDKYHDTIYVKGIDVSADSGATWTTLPQSAVRYGNDSVCRNRACLRPEDDSLLASSVNAIKFRFDNNENNYVGYLEIEVLGDRNPSGRVQVSALGPTEVNLKGVCTALGVTAASAEFYFAYGTSAEGLEPEKQTGIIQVRDGAVTLALSGLNSGTDYYYAYYFQNDEGFVSDVATGKFRTADTNNLLYWDPGQTKSDGGGSGGWFDENAWYDPVAGDNVTWDSTCKGKDLVFGGTAGRIQLNAPTKTTVETGVLHFLTAGYVVDLEASPDASEWNSTRGSSSLTCTGIVGEDGQIYKTINKADATLTIDVPAGKTLAWDGEAVGSGSSRLKFQKDGAGTQSIRKVNMASSYGQPSLMVMQGRLNLTGTGSGGGSSKWFIKEGAVLDIGSNTIAVRQLDVDLGGTVITSEGGALEHAEGRWESATVDGWLTGNLQFRISASYDTGRYAVLSNPLNDYTGGTYITGQLKNGLQVAHLHVTADTALGTGPVVLENTANLASLEFESAEPVIGSLASANAGRKQVLLGGTENDTALTVGLLNTDTDFDGRIMDANGHVGSLVKVGTGTLTLSGTNTFTGTTSVRAGTLRLTNAEATLATLNIEVDGGELTGPAEGVGMIGCDLATPTGPMTLIAGTLDLTNLGFAFTGLPVTSPTVLVDYSQGGTLVLGDEVFATGVPDDFRIVNDPARQQIILTRNGLAVMVR